MGFWLKVAATFWLGAIGYGFCQMLTHDYSVWDDYLPLLIVGGVLSAALYTLWFIG